PSLFLCFERRLGNFLREQWHAVSTFNNVAADAFRQPLIADDALDQYVDLAPRVRRLSVSDVTWRRPIHGGAKSGRNVTTANALIRSMRSNNRLSVSKLEESAMCVFEDEQRRTLTRKR